MDQWSSRLGFILAAIGAAVGLGNIWRFPAVVGQNGGGAYLIPYLLAAITLAIPLLILEISIGRSLKADIVTACRQVRDRFEIVGWLIGASVLAILSYYLVITGWVLAFLIFTITGSGTTFDAFSSTYQPIGFFIVVSIIVGAIVSLGVSDGIERMAKTLIPAAIVILAGLGVYAATLPGFTAGASFFFRPDLRVLNDPFIWSAAFGQVFFSFSVGMGVMLTYGSYLDQSVDIPRSAFIIAAADIAIAMLAGLVIFAIVFSFGLEPTMGTELAFSTLPAGFAEMPFGWIVGVAFFGLLFLAAITPSVSMLEVGVASVMRSTTLSRRSASILVTGLILFAGLPSALSYSAVELTLLDRPFLDLLDSSVGTLALPISAVLIVIIFTWFQPARTVREQLGDTIILPIVKYIVPTVLIVVTSVRIFSGVDFYAWRRVPGIAGVDDQAQLIVLVGFLGISIIAGWYLYRR